MSLVKLHNTKLTHRNLLHSYTLTMKYQKDKQTVASHQKNEIKFLSINLLKEAKILYSENYKILIGKKKKLTSRDGEIYHVLGLK